MATARCTGYYDGRVAIEIRDLQYPASRYLRFTLYIDSVYCGTDSSGNSYNSCDLSYDVSHINDGWYNFRIGATFVTGAGTEGTSYISGSNQIHIDRGGGSGGDPTPNIHELTYIKILRFLSVEDGSVKVEIETDGYGTVDLVSVTKGWNLTDGSRNQSYVYVASDYIEKYHLSNGKFQGTVSYTFDRTDLSSFPSVPVGTCHLAGGGGLNDYGTFSKAFICMSQYGNWTTYDGTYSTTLKYDNGKMYAGVDYLSTVRSDWIRLVNMSFYLDATAYGTIKYSQYSNYIPRYGDIITAWMYNALVDSVRDCCQHLNFNYYDMPTYVSSGDIIPRDFISKLGRVVDNALITQRMRTNDAVIRGY